MDRRRRAPELSFPFRHSAHNALSPARATIAAFSSAPRVLSQAQRLLKRSLRTYAACSCSAVKTRFFIPQLLFDHFSRFPKRSRPGQIYPHGRLSRMAAFCASLKRRWQPLDFFDIADITALICSFVNSIISALPDQIAHSNKTRQQRYQQAQRDTRRREPKPLSLVDHGCPRFLRRHTSMPFLFPTTGPNARAGRHLSASLSETCTF